MFSCDTKLGEQLMVEGGGLTSHFLKIEKGALILVKKTLIISIFGLNFSLKCSFKRIYEKNLQNSCRVFFSCVFDEMFIEVP